jgi:dCMP deaminase
VCISPGKSEEILRRKDGDLIPKSTSDEDEEDEPGLPLGPFLPYWNGRPTWEDTFFDIAWLWSRRATCPRRSVGCVIVDQFNAVVASGYNGAPRGMPHCTDVGCTMEGKHCVSAIHAEMNALAYAARRGVSVEGCEAYCTLLPCIQCAQLLLASGVKIVHFDETYLRSERNNLYRLAVLGGMKLIERHRR